MKLALKSNENTIWLQSDLNRTTPISLVSWHSVSSRADDLISKTKLNDYLYDCQHTLNNMTACLWETVYKWINLTLMSWTSVQRVHSCLFWRAENRWRWMQRVSRSVTVTGGFELRFRFNIFLSPDWRMSYISTLNSLIRNASRQKRNFSVVWAEGWNVKTIAVYNDDRCMDVNNSKQLHYTFTRFRANMEKKGFTLYDSVKCYF